MWNINCVIRLLYTRVKPRGSLDKRSRETRASVNKQTKIKLIASTRHQTSLLQSFILHSNQYTETLYSLYACSICQVSFQHPLHVPKSYSCLKRMWICNGHVPYIHSGYSAHNLKIIWHWQWNGLYKFLYFLSLFLPKYMMYNYKEQTFCYGRAIQTLWTISVQKVTLGFPILSHIGQIRSLHYIVHCDVLHEVRENLSKIYCPKLFLWGKSRSKKDTQLS